MRAIYKIELTKMGYPVKQGNHPKVFDHAKFGSGYTEPLIDHLGVYQTIRKSLIEQFGADKVMGKIEGDYSVLYVE